MLAKRKLAAIAATIVAFCLTCPGTTGRAAEPNHEQTFLGIGVEPVSPALASHLHESLAEGQGLLVTGVAPNSPAAKCGLKVHDVLTSYGDQKLFSVKQLVGLVRLDKPGHEVALEIVRGGKPISVKVTLGEHEVPRGAATMQYPEPRIWELPAPSWFAPRGEMPHQFAGSAPEAAQPEEWKSFDSMTVKKLGKDRFQVEIRYLDKKGGIDRADFEGSREDIHKAILARKDLPAEERHELIRSLDLPMSGPASLASRIQSDFNELWDQEFRGRTF